MERLRLKLLGPLSVTGVDGRAIDLVVRKSRVLLAILALALAHSATRERLAFLLWSDHDDAHARSSLRQTLTVLRKELGDGVLDCEDERVQLADATSDVDDFIRLASSSDRNGLRQAVELWSGELLAYFDVH
jgi:DNA-binding SARP family transcriptional activator